MLYRNSIKILFSNFRNVWKSILYFVGIFIVSVFLLYLSIHSIYSLLDSTGFIQGLIDVYANFMKSLDLEELLMSCKSLGGEFLDILRDNINDIWVNFLGIFLTIFVFDVIVANLSIMANCNSLNYYMGSMNEHGFYSSYGETIGKNLKATFIHYIITLPIKLIIGLVFVLSLKLFNVKWLWSFFTVFIIVCLLILMLSFKLALFSAWVPAMVVMNYGPWRSLKANFKIVFKKFGRIFGTSVGIVLTLMAVNLFLGVFTFGVGLLVSIPATYMLFSVFGMIVTFEGQGMRYYVDIYNVITPVKKKDDKLIEMKFIV